MHEGHHARGPVGSACNALAFMAVAVLCAWATYKLAVLPGPGPYFATMQTAPSASTAADSRPRPEPHFEQVTTRSLPPASTAAGSRLHPATSFKPVNTASPTAQAPPRATVPPTVALPHYSLARLKRCPSKQMFYRAPPPPPSFPPLGTVDSRVTHLWFLYLVQGVEPHEDPHLVAEMPRRHIVWLTYKELPAIKGVEVIYRPNTTWTTGRNQHLEYALEWARSNRIVFEYAVFLDEDVLLQLRSRIDGVDNPWDVWESFLLEQRPVDGFVYWHSRLETDNTCLDFSRCPGLTYADGCIAAVHRSAIGTPILPYSSLLVSVVDPRLRHLAEVEKVLSPDESALFQLCPRRTNKNRTTTHGG